MPHLRILRCDVCKTIDEVPDWTDGPDTDPYLPRIVERHKDHHGQLFRVPIGLWLDEKTKENIIRQITEKGLGLEAFSPGFYDLKNQFHEDAHACFDMHKRPQDGCPEFRGIHKQIKPPDTSKDRKELGLAPVKSGPKVYLCDFCPVRSTLSKKVNEKRFK